MKKIIVLGMILISLFNFVLAEEQRVYSLTLKYDHGIVSKERLVLTSGIYFSSVYQPEDKYKLNIISFADEELYSLGFDFPLFVFGSSTQLEEAEKDFILPYFANGKSIIIYNPSNIKILEIDISQYATERLVEFTPSEYELQDQEDKESEQQYFRDLIGNIQQSFKGEDKKEEQKSLSVDCRDGCKHNNNCYNAGYRLGATYCSENKWMTQKRSNENCDNNYECLNDECSNGKCSGKEINKFRVCLNQLSFMEKIYCIIGLVNF